jgi:iron complex outermembrane receptor protein
MICNHQLYRFALVASTAATVVASAFLAAIPEPARGQAAPARALEEVVVTARRREEQLQDVPISIEALSMQEMELRGIESGADLNTAVPNLALGNSFVNVGTLVTLRGIPNVGIYVDGIWQQSAGFFQNRIVDLERVEVMRGPQGTLFGRNTNGGAIQYTTRPPSEEFGATGSVTLGSYDRQDVTLSVNVPLTKGFFMKWTGATMKSDGWLRSVAVPDRAYGGRDDKMLRGDFLWRPTDRFEARLTATKSDTVSPPARQIRWSTQGLPPGVPEHFRLTVYNVAMLNPDYGPYDFWTGPLPQGTNRFPIHAFTAETHDPEYPGGETGKFENHSLAPKDANEFDIDQYTFTVSWDVNDKMSLTSLSAYREQFTRGLSDFFTSEIVFALTDNRLAKDRLYSEELHFEGSVFNDSVDFLIGAYYSNERNRFRHYRWGMSEFFVPDENGDPVPDQELISFVNAWGVANGNARIANWSPVYFYDGGIADKRIPGRTTIDDNVTQEYALFGESTWRATDRLDFTAGVRFAWNDGTERTREATEAYRDLEAPIITGTRGYGPGDPFAGPVIREEDDFLTTDVVVTPAVSLAYHWNDSLMAYVRYAEGFTRGEENFNEDLQRTITLEPEVVKNRELGFRSDWLRDRLRFNITLYEMIWNGLRVTKQFPTPEGDLILASVSGGKARARGYESELVFVPGDAWRIDFGYAMNDTTYLEVGDESPLTPNTPWGFAPKYNANFGTQYDLSLSNGATLTFRGDAGYTSSYQMDPAVQRQAPQPESGYTLYNARIRYMSPDENWSVSFFGNNLSDERYIAGGIDAGQLWGIQFLDIGQRRTVGVRVDVDLAQ